MGSSVRVRTAPSALDIDVGEKAFAWVLRRLRV